MEEITTKSPSPLMVGAAVLGGAMLLTNTQKARAATAELKYQKDIPGSGDIKVLNYALALEALEADLYDQALKRLTTGGTNGLGTTITGLNLGENEPDVKYITEFKQVEIDHRDFLIAAIGPKNILATKLEGALFDFNMENLNRRQVVELVLLAEATGVGAYLGAIPKFETRKYLQLAAAIQGTEARHTAAITVVKNKLFGTTDPPAPLYNDNRGIDKSIAPDDVLTAVSPFIVLP